VITEAVRRSGVDPEVIDDVLLGATKQHGELGGNVARNAALLAGLPFQVAGSTVNRLCGSGLEAIARACQAIRCGEADVQLAGGVEHMHHLPMESQLDIHPQVFARSSRAALSMGLTAEHLAETYGISRLEQDRYACLTQTRCQEARRRGLFDDEIVPVAVPRRKGGPVRFDTDEHPRDDVTVESLAKLKPAFRDGGTVTAGSASGINDAAAAVVLMDEATAAGRGLRPLAVVRGFTSVGLEPMLMGMGPAKAIEKLLAREGLSLGEIDLLEVNEAFAAQVLAVGRALDWDAERVNVSGGAIALGHPLGATGTRISVTLLHEMRRRGCRLGIAALCIGGGMGIAMLFERPPE